MGIKKIKYKKPFDIGKHAPSTKLLKKNLKQTNSQKEKAIHVLEYINILKAYHTKTKSKSKQEKYKKKLTKYEAILKNMNLPTQTNPKIANTVYNDYIAEYKQLENNKQQYENSKIYRNQIMHKSGILQLKKKTNKKKIYNTLYNTIAKARYDKAKSLLNLKYSEMKPNTIP